MINQCIRCGEDYMLNPIYKSNAMCRECIIEHKEDSKLDFSFGKVEDLIVFAVREYNAKLMGDDFIGYKFVGDKSEFWNHVLKDQYEKDADFSFLNTEWLKEKDIDVLEHDSEVWNQ